MKDRIEIDDPVLIVRVNTLYRPSMLPIELYEITRGVWKVSPPRRDRVKYALTVHQGRVKEVYKVNAWHPACSSNYLWRTQFHEDAAMVGRSEFTGEIANATVRTKYLGKSVAHLFAQGAANPVKYVNC